MICPGWLRWCLPACRRGAYDPSLCASMTEANRQTEVEEYAEGMGSRVHGEGVDLRRRKGTDFESRGNK